MATVTPIRAVLAQRMLPRASASAFQFQFHTSSVRRGLKESDHSRDDLAEIYENEKLEQLKKSKEGKGKWSQNLASNSEASVKADRGEAEEDVNFAELQEKTKNEAGKKR